MQKGLPLFRQPTHGGRLAPRGVLEVTGGRAEEGIYSSTFKARPWRRRRRSRGDRSGMTRAYHPLCVP